MTGTLLIDADSRIPNLALMHISAWEKAHGRDAGFYVSDPDRVYASIVFTKNRHLADGLRFLYPDAVIDIGGTGYDLKKTLPPEMDRMMHDEEFTSALERCELLKSWGATPYIMTDPTSKHTRRMKDLKRWARPWIFWKTDFSDYKKRNE